jgi:hypothetical protein
MPKEDFVSITIKRDVYERMRKLMDNVNATLGYRRFKSVSQLLEEAFVYYEKSYELMIRFKHFNVYEDHVTIVDYEEHRLVDVFFKNGKPHCMLCNSDSCIHVKFTLRIPKVVEKLREKGYKVEDGDIVYSPP